MEYKDYSQTLGVNRSATQDEIKNAYRKMPFEIMLRAEDDDPFYIRSEAIQMARVTSDILVLCEQEGLVSAQVMTGGEMGFNAEAIRQLVIIRRLYQELDLDLETIDLVLHMRRQIIDLHHQLDDLEQRTRQREQIWLSEIRELRHFQTPDSEIE